MKYGLKFYCEKPIKLPVNYNKILQASLLSWIDTGKYSHYLHDEGFLLNKRKYKLFTFSNIKGNYVFDKRSKTMMFTDEICLILSFYTGESHEYILKNIRDEKPIRFGDNYACFIECAAAEEYYQNCIVDTVSPVTVHTTMLKSDGKKFTYYYEPTESGFEKLIAENLVHKIEALYGKAPEDKTFIVRPYKRTRLKRITTNYGGLTVKAWNGSFEIKGSGEMIKMALLSGIGDKNSIGFGCVLQRNVCDVEK